MRLIGFTSHTSPKIVNFSIPTDAALALICGLQFLKKASSTWRAVSTRNPTNPYSLIHCP